MPDIINLETLTARIYHEGIEKADRESLEIIKKAEEKSEQIVNAALAEAKEIREKAKREADSFLRSGQNDLQLKGAQFVNNLKQQVMNALNERIIDATLDKSFEDQEFIQSLILETVRHWNTADDLQLELPAKLKGKLENAFRKSLAEKLENLEIMFNHKVETGFRISRKGDSFRIEFNDEAFGELFKSYLGDRTRKIIFKENG